MKDVIRFVNKARRELGKEYPGASDEAVLAAIQEKVSIAFTSPKTADPDDLGLLFDMTVASAEQDWSAELENILLESVVRPEFDKAIEAGVDPVPVIRANCSMSESKAREVVAKLTSKSASKEASAYSAASGVAPVGITGASDDADAVEIAQA